MNTTYILIGTNLGDRQLNLKTAIAMLKQNCGEVKSISGIYETSPWGISNQPPFLNMVIQLETRFTPENLLQSLLSIETKMGRERKEKWGERLIDLDILYYNDAILVTKELTIPHPELHKRQFTLVPLCEIAPHFKHPVLNISNDQLLLQCADKGTAIRVDSTL